tara:strand:- start:49 stop:2991 length:2943 start_codon:yes stop_codon:yes gene_type:complete
MAINDQSPADLLAADTKSSITDTQATAQPELVQTAFLSTKAKPILDIVKDPDKLLKPKGSKGPESPLQKEAVADADQLKKTADETVGPPQGEDFNFSTFNNDDDIFRMLDSFTQTKGTTATTKVTQKETASTATEDVKEFLSLSKNWNNKNVLFTPSQVVGMKEMLVQSADVLKTYSKRIKIDNDDSTATLFLFREQMARHASLVKVFKTGRANIARALDAFKIPPGYKSNINDFEAMVVGELGGSKVAIKQAEKILEFADNPDKLHKLVESSFGQKRLDEFMEVYINGLLSSPRSQFRNLFGNAIYQAYSVPETAIGAVAGSIERTFKKGVNYSTGVKYFDNVESGIHFNEAMARIQSYGHSWRKAWKAANQAFEQPVSGTKLEHASFRKEAISSGNYGVNSNSIGGKGIDMMGKVIRFPGTALVWGDEFFKTMAREAELYELAVRKQNDLLRQGVPVDEVTERVADDLFNNKSTIDSVEDAAKYYTFQTDLGALGQWIQEGQDFAAIRLFMPFVRTPINIAKAFARRTPGSLVEGLFFPTSFGKRFREDAVFRNREMGKIALGSATIYGAMEFFQAGKITGQPPRSSKERDLYLNTYKIQPYSFVFAGADTDASKPLFNPETGQPNGTLSYVSYAGIEPFGSFLGVTATAMDIMNRSDDPAMRDSVGQAALSATYEYYKQLPFLQGIASIYEILGLDYSEDENATFRVDRLITELSGTIIPFRTLAGGFKNIKDPYKRATGVNFMDDLDFEPRLLDKKGFEVLDDMGFVRPNPNYGIPKSIDSTMGQSIKNFQNLLDQVGKQLQKTIPIVSGKLPMKYSYDFTPMEVGHGVNSIFTKTYNMVSPFYYSVGDKVSEAEYDVMRLGVPGYSRSKSYYGIKFDDKNWARLMERAGQLLDDDGFTFKEARVELYYDDDYQDGTGKTGNNDDNRRRLLTNLRKDFLERAFISFLDEGDELFTTIYEAAEFRKELLAENTLGKR